VSTREVLAEVAEASGRREVEPDVVGNAIGSWDSKRLHQAMSNLVFTALKYGDQQTRVKETRRATWSSGSA
jgi:signal transduction histidine kinase